MSVRPRPLLKARTSWWAPCLAVVLAGCVPEGPATSTASSASPKAPPPAARTSVAPPAATSDGGAMLTAPFEDTFERAELGPAWNALSPRWKIQDGRLCVRNARNRGAWLVHRIPVNARIEFDAVADSADGDLKVEVWGDGRSGATQASYTNATSYVLILGGWKNSKHVLARLDEHGDDRVELDVEPGSDDERARPVETGQPYRFKIERKDGRTITWSINGEPYFELADPDPLAGPGHEHFAFNDWDAPVCFDNLKITPL